MATLEEILGRHPGAQSFRFGDSPELCDLLLRLVVAGRKTATCGALRDYPPDDPSRPVVGRRDVATDWEGRPVVVIETTEVTERRFDAVDEAFMLAEGENDTLDGWRRDHRAYFERNGGWSADMMLLCERFRVVEDCAP
ncbi:ASCH domain-containing protein [Jannaschia marina]|uniref:ASCH domain-containing protein n=1 Tax=Jannaschia marina TaxID=2741674 RepID=UPI0015C96E97|nr:ASCH domain-containing protein [Jannaschia marina]